MIMKAEIVGETPYKKFMFDTDFDELAERREKARAKAAAEAAIGLAILVIFYRNRGTIAVEDVNMMKG